MAQKQDITTSENLKAMQSILERIKLSIDRKETTKLSVEVLISNGAVSGVTWKTEFYLET
jgi:hypothetical protein